MIQKQSPIPLIVGAGPTGMMLSLWLLKLKVPHRIVDASSGPGRDSRSMLMHARSLEFYRQLDLDEAMIALGAKLEKHVVHYNNKPRTQLSLKNAGQDASKYPFFLSITQDEQEALLDRTIIERGGQIERGVKVVGVEEKEGDDFVTVTLDVDGQEELIQASYVIGCDGARSIVRRSQDISMEGDTNDRTLFVADVIVTGLPSAATQINIFLTAWEYLVVVPLPHQEGRARLIGRIPEHLNPEDATFDDVVPVIRSQAPDLQVKKVTWFSRYKIHHRAASRFQQGRIFLCGDAAHIHSPVGGQGMNTGLGDASNLAWKLAAVYHGAPPSLLETYAQERMPFAKKLVQTLDYAFTTLTGNSWLSYFVRNYLIPYAGPHIIRYFNLPPLMFRKLSQIGVEYQTSPLSAAVSTTASEVSVKAGDRLPWICNVNEAGDDNYKPLEKAVWQAHFYGKVQCQMEEKLQGLNIPVHKFLWNESMDKAGLQRDLMYLIRPDGYIGLILDAIYPEHDGQELHAYLEKWIGCNRDE